MDDFVILCRSHATEARKPMQAIMSRLKLTVNEQKRRTCRVAEESFAFLGYSIGRCYSPKGWTGLYGQATFRQASQRHLQGSQPKDSTGILLETGRDAG